MVDVGRRDVFLYYSYVYRVKMMSCESAGGGQEPRAGEDLLTHIPVKMSGILLDCLCLLVYNMEPLRVNESFRRVWL